MLPESGRDDEHRCDEQMPPDHHGRVQVEFVSEGCAVQEDENRHESFEGGEGEERSDSQGDAASRPVRQDAAGCRGQGEEHDQQAVRVGLAGPHSGLPPQQ
ncbi:hypothetical protein [Streptosporangium sp. NPDC002607]